MKYGPGHASRNNLMGLCNDMTRVVFRCYELLSYYDVGVDMSVIETVRTMETQIANVEAGVSWSLDSDHIRPDADGSGVLAVDLYPYIPGVGTSHDRMHYDIIAKRMFQAGDIEGVPVKWGGFWQKRDKNGVLVPNFDGPHFAKRLPRILKG